MSRVDEFGANFSDEMASVGGFESSYWSTRRLATAVLGD